MTEEEMREADSWMDEHPWGNREPMDSPVEWIGPRGTPSDRQALINMLLAGADNYSTRALAEINREMDVRPARPSLDPSSGCGRARPRKRTDHRQNGQADCWVTKRPPETAEDPIFYCVLALMVAKLMTREADRSGMHLSVRGLLESLAGIEETLLHYQGERGRSRARRMLTEMDTTQRRLYDLFGLHAYAPKR